MLSVPRANVRCCFLSGTLDRTSLGFASAPINTNGNGPGAGTTSLAAGSGGASHFGLGGTGGLDAGDTPGVGGPPYGTLGNGLIELGSSDGSGSGPSDGGAGGGALALVGWRITGSGTVNVSGGTVPVEPPSRNSGGGSGGGILLSAGFADLGGLLLRANGGGGGTGTITANDSGGGGGGGEIELHASIRLGAPTTEVLGGPGWPEREPGTRSIRRPRSGVLQR